MRLSMRWKRSIQKDTRAISPAISMAIITAATIVMVLVSSTYAYSALRRQQASSEFDAIQKSFQTFDDTVRDVAWNRASARNTHFTADYGFIESAGPYNLSITANIPGVPTVDFTPDVQTAILRYNLSTTYLTFGNNYQNYVVGDNRQIVDTPTDPVGQLVVTQKDSWININLGYRIRVMTESASGCTYVDVLVTRLSSYSFGTNGGDFDLLARNANVVTTTYPQAPIHLDSPSPFTVNVTLENIHGQTIEWPYLTNPDSFSGVLAAGNVVFNFIVTTVQAGP